MKGPIKEAGRGEPTSAQPGKTDDKVLANEPDGKSLDSKEGGVAK